MGSTTSRPEVGPLELRLDRLESYLRDDPGNQALLMDAFEVALQCGAWDRAQLHLSRGCSLSGNEPGWRFRAGELLLAQGKLAEAAGEFEGVYDSLDKSEQLRAVVLHNLAFIDLHRGMPQSAVARLAPLMEVISAAAVPPGQPFQLVWLRALHRTGDLSRALDWSRATEGRGALDPEAAGVASLIALDEEDFLAAQRWSQNALSHRTSQSRPLEALNVQASLALAKGDVAASLDFCDQALQLQTADGRSWSIKGFAHLMAKAASQSEACFQRALTFMPEHLGTWIGLATGQMVAGKFAEAEATLSQALAIDRNFAEIHGCLAVIRSVKGDRVNAQVDLERALGLDPDCVSAQYAKAMLAGSELDLKRWTSTIERLSRSLSALHSRG